MGNLAFVTFALVSAAASPPTAPGLFSAIEQRSSAVAGPDPTIIRRRSVAVAHEQLSHVGRSIPVALNFNLFHDVQLQGMMTGVVAQSALGSVLAGNLPGIKDGRFMLAVQGDVVLGNIRAPGVGYFQIRYLGNGVHEVREIDESEFPPCATDEHDDGATPPPMPAPRGEPGDCDDDGSVIDLMVVYTAEARVAQGGTAAMEALIALSEAETNQAYANSLLNSTSVRVVFTYEVDYIESGSSSTDRERLSTPDDGHMDEVPVLRDEVAADVVTLLVNDFEVCGRAFFSISAGNVPHPELGFNVVQASCSAGNFTFGHELAHNQGCRHDRQHDPSDGGAFLYSHGYIEPQGLFRTVMGVSTPGISRIQYFSNSDVSYQGEPTGLPVGDPDSAHNALTIENTAYNVANFRRSNDCNGNGICDDVELATGIAQDCNGNGVPDDCDGDCNGNGAADECDIAQGVSQDCTGNGVPDECESDCNANGFADSCDILDGTSVDENGDGFPDECQQPILYVDSTATGANNGTTWSDAFVGPHDAFDLARDPRVGVQEIWVRAAVYKPDVPNGDRERTFRLPNGVGVYGGFAGWETKRDERDPRQNETVFSGDLNGNDDSTDGTRFDNSYHVVTVAGPDVSTPTVFDGFVVKSGSNADAPPLSRQGAGMQISGAAPIIRNCLFTENRGHSGAGLKITNESSPLVSRCRFIGNIVSAGSGGAIGMNFGGRLDLRDSVFIGNAATQQGSAILATASSVVTISHCTFLDNPALAPQAGVIANRLDSRIDIVGSIIWDTLGSPDLLSVGTLDYPSTLTVQHSVVRGGIGSAHVEVDSIFIWGDGNIDQDPLLDVDGVHLLALSPCIGRGDPARERSSLDIDGEPRVQFCRADMGADETDFMLDCNGNGQADACDVAAGTSEDVNRNGRPDECEFHLSYVDVNNCPGPGSGTLADPFCEIQSALDGDGLEEGTILDIVVADGVYVGPNNRDLDLGGREMRLRSANGPQNCIIDAGGDGRAVYLPRGLAGFSILDGFTIQGGSAAVGGGIYVQNARSLIRNCIVKNNTAGAGGGIMIQGGGTEIRNCVVTDNQADFGGGIRIEQQGLTPRILGCAIRDNIAAHGGGVSCEGGGGWFEGCTISGNRANAVGLAEGGGVWLRDSSTSFVGCTIEDNSAAAGDTGFGSGGGVFIFAAGTTTLEGCTIRNNAAGGPGGSFIEDRKGGGLYILGGGFFFGQPNIAVRNCAISGNTARLGGGVYVRGAEPTFERCVIAENTALPFGTFGHGGGVYALNVDASFQDCTIRRNAAENGEGGGVHNSNGTLRFVQCQITGNEAAVGGGGIYTRVTGAAHSLSFMSGLIYGNTAGSDGGGIFVRSASGGTQVLDLSNSILWGNSGSGSTEDNQLGFWCTSTCENIIGYNCVQGWTGALGGDGNFGDDPGFVDPDGEDDRLGTGDDDLRVHVGSPVIDAGDNLSVPSNLTADFAGNPRFVDDPLAPDTGRGTPPIVDIGAFEGGLDCNGNGVSDLDDVANGTSQDCTGNGVPDECELDCDGNAVADICDILDGTSPDCNENGLTDVCEIEQSGLADCDGNGIPDECEDTTNDCNNNGVWDECDLDEGTSQDCNATGIPDECETDCNGNGLSDECDIANGTSFDDNANGIPDECERPPLQALQPHEIQKNRYVSFTPNTTVVVAYRIEGLTNAYFPGVAGLLGWVDMPDEDGISLLTQNPVYRDDWPSVVHLGGCAIVPVATYAIRATTNGVHFSDSLTVETVGQPGGGKFWGDTVGAFDGTQWTPPQGVTNIDDAVAVIRSWQAADGAPHVSVADVEPQHPNRVVNFNDVLQIVLAFQGNRYPYGCPDDPCRDNLANPCP